MIVNKYQGNGGGGYVLPVASQSTLGGVKIGSGISIDSGGTISANGGGKTVVNFDGTSQADRATLYTTLKALYDGGSGNTINDVYAFYKTLNSNQGVPFDYYQFDSANTLILGAVVTSGNSTAYEQVLKITSDGSVTISTNAIGGGSAEQNYQIVDNISEVQNPQAGTKVYVRSGSTVETYSGIAFDASTVSEGYVAQVFDGQGSKYFDIYRSGDNFFWDWENDGNIHTRTSLDKLFYYKSDTTNHIFYLFPTDTATTLVFREMGEGVTTGDTSTGVTVTWEAQSLMYTGSEYVSTSDVIYDLDNMTQSEIAALNAYLNSASEIERVGAHIYKDRNKCRYDRIENSRVRFECHYISNSLGFAFIKNYIFYIKTDGTLEYDDNGSEYGIPATFEVNYTAHTLTSTNTPIWAAARGINKGVIPVIYLLSGTTGVAVAKDAYIERTDDWTGIIGATFEYSGQTIEAKWSYNENTATLVSWTVGGGAAGPTVINLDTLKVLRDQTWTKYDFTTSAATCSGGATVATGDTCSDPWAFEIVNTKHYADGEFDNNINNMAPLFAFRITDTDSSDKRYSNPILHYDTITTVVLNDSDGNPHNFNYKFYFDYGDFVVTLLANEDEYRYARFTVTKR